ncbi:unnamed protein product [Ectocarpus sp. CCAP 1310/34]|nr:unnamed protein product [Ectocarpus sp. CCAP 1310/34]
MKSSFHQITVHRDTILLTAFVTSSRLFECLKMPQGSSAAPGWFCKVVNEVIKSLHGVASYFDDLIVFDDNPASHVDTMRALFERLRTHNLKLTLPKATIGGTEADFLGHTISPDGIRPNGVKVAALTTMPTPKDVKQLRSLLGGLSYYRKFLPNMATRIQPLTTLLKKQATFVFTSAMEQAVRVLLSELANPPVLSDSSIRPIVFISGATLDSERHWTPLDLEAGSIVLSIKRLRGYLWGTKFRIFTDHKSPEHFAKVGENNARVQRWLELLTAYNYSLEYRKGSPNGNADFLSRLPIDAAESDRSGRSRLTPDDDEEGVFFIRSCGLTPSGHRAVGVGLGGHVPKTPASVLGGLAPSTADFVDFRRHGPRLSPSGPLSPPGIWNIAPWPSKKLRELPPSRLHFTAEGTADILVNRYIPLWGCPLNLLSDNGSQFCSKLSQAVCARLAIRKVATSSYHPKGNTGVERVNHTMAQMLAMVVNERQDDWDIHLPLTYLEKVYQNKMDPKG